MINRTFEKELHQHLDKLPLEQQRQVLDFARTLSATPVRGVPGQNLIRFSGSIQTADLVVMAQAIEDDCEKVALDEW